MESQQIILQALRFLAARCDGAESEDGQGYAKGDSYLGKRLATQNYLTNIQTEQALDMLRKYEKTQLNPAGIKLPLKEKALDEARKLDMRRGKIFVEGYYVEIEFPYHAELVKLAKSIPGAFWVASKMRWSYPLKNGKQVVETFGGFDITLTDLEKIENYNPADELPANYLDVSGKLIHIYFKYAVDLVTIVKSIPGAKFVDTHPKHWTVPIDQLQKVNELYVNWHRTINFNNAIATLEAQKEAEKAVNQTIANKLRGYTCDVLPNGRVLFDHQKSGYKFLLENRRAIFADDMGLGKTLQSLVAARAFELPVIVLCPASLQINWKREAAMVGVEIQVYSWAKVPAVPTHDFVLIADEAHYMQNLKAQRTKAALALTESQHCIAAYMLTGTPIKNGRPVNLFPLLKAIRHKLAQNKTYFEKRYCNAHQVQMGRVKFWDNSGASNLPELHAQIKDSLLRRTKEQCLDLPGKIRVQRTAELSTEAKRAYDDKYKLAKEAFLKGQAGAALVQLGTMRHNASIAKIETALELANEVIEQGNQVVIFTWFKDTAIEIAAKLHCGCINGDLPVEQRQNFVDCFQKGINKAIVCTYGAGGVGITLTAAQTVILVDRPYTPGDVDQAEDRLNRIGQQNKVTSVWLQYGNTDLMIDKLLASKAENINVVLYGKETTLSAPQGIDEKAAQAILETVFNTKLDKEDATLLAALGEIKEIEL